MNMGKGFSTPYEKEKTPIQPILLHSKIKPQQRRASNNELHENDAVVTAWTE